MKTKLKYSIMQLVALLLLSSCNDLLDRQPQNFLQERDFMKTEAQATSMLNAVYDPLSREALFGVTLSIQYQTDDLFFQNRATTTSPNIYLNNPTAANSELKSTWNMLYDGVARANYFLENIQKPSMNESKRNRYRGEALFLRAFYYYQLVQTWGAVPLRLNSIADLNNVSIARTPADSVLRRVVLDMEEAEALVGRADDNTLAGSRVTQSVARGILARVYLTMGGKLYEGLPNMDKTKMYEKALYWAYQVKKSKIHRLNDSFVLHNYSEYGYKKDVRDTDGNILKPIGSFQYMEVFQRMVADKLDFDCRESIWEAMMSGNRQDPINQETGRISSQFGVQFTSDAIKEHKAWYNYAMYNISATLWRLFNTDNGTVIDKRRNTACAPYQYSIHTPSPTIDSVFVIFYAEDGVKVARPFSGSGEKKNNVGVNSPDTMTFSISGRYAGKFLREHEPYSTRDKNGTSCNFPLLRYSDVLLMIAEAGLQVKNLGGRTPDEITDLNAEIRDCVQLVRARAGVDATTPATLTMEFIRDERGRELCLEGLRRTDMIRWFGRGFYKELQKGIKDMSDKVDFGVSKAHVDRVTFILNNLTERSVYYPIPASELSLNPFMTQNPGW